jgi:hypothetical protein
MTTINDVSTKIIECFTKIINDMPASSGKVKVKELTTIMNADELKTELSAILSTMLSANKPKRQRIAKLKDPNAPKRPATPFLKWSADHRNEFKEANPDLDSKDLAKLLGKTWKEELDASDKKPYEEVYEKAKKKYEKKMKKYERPNDSVLATLEINNKPKRGSPKADKKKRAKKDPNAPKRAPTAFMLFSSDMREQVKKDMAEENGTDPSAKEVMTRLGSLWTSEYKEHPDKCKKWVKKAEKEKAKYEARKAEYESKKESDTDSTPKSAKQSDDESDDESDKPSPKSKTTKPATKPTEDSDSSSSDSDDEPVKPSPKTKTTKPATKPTEDSDSSSSDSDDEPVKPSPKTKASPKTKSSPKTKASTKSSPKTKPAEDSDSSSSDSDTEHLAGKLPPLNMRFAQANAEADSSTAESDDESSTPVKSKSVKSPPKAPVKPARKTTAKTTAKIGKVEVKSESLFGDSDSDE